METVSVSLDDIVPSTSPPPTQPDEKTIQERQDLDKAYLDSFKQDVNQRKLFAPKIFLLIVWWLVGMFALLVLEGFHPLGFSLPESVLIAAISGTTLNVLGIFAIVANYIFRKR